jgi:hypothetical protein
MKAKPVAIEGINFRSKLEAHWFLYLQDLGFQLQYEPYTIEFRRFSSSKYIPDFWMINGGKGVCIEIKPMRQYYPDRDKVSIQKAYLTSQDVPTIIVLGSPYEYFACYCDEFLDGYIVGHSIQFSLQGFLLRVGKWKIDFEPSIRLKAEDFVDPRAGAEDKIPVQVYGPARDIVNESWLKLKEKGQRI